VIWLTNAPVKKIYLPDVVGKGYATFWNYKGRNRSVKGSRASKKSKTAALWYIYNMMKYPLANTLVVRQVYSTLKDSCYTELKWAINRLGVSHLWKCTLSPLEMTYKPTGQKIYFRGMDDPLKLTSITVEVGYLCWAWCEEAYQIVSEKDFDTLNESIRGYIPPETGLFKQITLTFNPWSSTHWIKKRFYDCEPDDDVLAITTNYMCNEWLDESDLRMFERMKKENPDRYKVAGLGEWGIDGMVFFPEFTYIDHVIEPFNIPKEWRRYRTLDYGMDMLACYWIAVDTVGNAYVYRELYEGRDNGKGLHGAGHIISEAAKRILELSPDDEDITATFAPPDLWNRRQESGKSVADIFSEYGIDLVKTSNDRLDGCASMHEWLKVRRDEFGRMKPRMQIFKNCINLIRCIPELQYDEKKVNDAANTPHEITHAPDAIRGFCVYWIINADELVDKDDDYIEYDDGLDNFFGFSG
jgi:phage terminase large subunit